MTEPLTPQQLREKSKMPIKQAGGMSVTQFFDKNKGVIQAVIPSGKSATRMLRIAQSALRTTPKLQDATVESLFGAVVTCAQLGLEPNTPNGHAYLIPFRNNQKNRTDVQVIIGYRGLIDLARRSGQIVSISAHAVYQADEFSYEYGLDEHCKHIPAIDGNRGEITHFYAVAKLVGGGYAFEVMSRAGVEKIRDNSQNWKTAVHFKNTAKSIWTLHFEEMGRKTLIRRLYKYLPTSIEMAQGGVIDTKGSAGEAQELDQALNADYRVIDEDQGTLSDPGSDGPEEVVNEATGEIFDPEKHLSPDKTNQDGSYTKRPHRGKSASTPVPAKTADPLAPAVAGMKAAATMDDLNSAREIANGPDFELDDGQLGIINSLYNARLAAIKSTPASSGDPGAGATDDFGNME